MMRNFKKLFSFCRNEKGFSLAEVMVAAGMLGVLSLGVMQVMKTQTKQSKKLAQDFEANQIISNVLNAFRDKAGCEATLDGLNISSLPVAFPQVQNGSGNIVAQTGTTYGNNTQGRITINRMEVTSYTAGTPGQAEVAIFFDKEQVNADSSFGGTQLRRTLTVSITDADANGTLNFGGGDSCYANEDFYVSGACAALGGVIDSADGLCKNLNIRNNQALAPADEYATRFSSGDVLITHEDASSINFVNGSITANAAVGASNVGLTGATDAGITLNAPNNTSITSTAVGGSSNITTSGVNSTVSVTGTAGAANVQANALGNNNATISASSAGSGAGALTASSNSGIARLNLLSNSVNYQFGNTNGGNLILSQGGTTIMSAQANGQLTTFPSGQVRVANTGNTTQTLTIGGSTANRYEIQGSANQLLRFSTAAGGTQRLDLGTDRVSGPGTLTLVGNEADSGTGASATNIELTAATTNYDANTHNFRRRNHGSVNSVLMNISGAATIPNSTMDALTMTGSTNDTWVVTKRWVRRFLSGAQAGSLTDTERAAIINHILNGTQHAGYVTARNNISNYTLGRHSVTLDGGAACPAGEYVSDINYNTTSGAFAAVCTTPPANNCSSVGNCATVYATNSLCVTSGGTKCLTKGYVAHTRLTSCQNVGTTGNAAEAYCTAGRFMVGVRSNGATIRCCSVRIL